MVTVYSSAAFSAVFGKETSYGVGSSGGKQYGALGIGMSLDTFSLQNQLDYIYQLGQRPPSNVYTAGRNVDIGTKFILADDAALTGSWLDFILQNNGANPPVWNVGEQASAYLLINTGAGNQYEISGVAFDTAGLTIATGKPVEVTVTGKGAGANYLTSTSTTVQYPSSPVTWTGIVLSVDGTPIAQPVTDLTINIKNSNQMFYTLGNVQYVAFVPTKFEVSGSFTVLHGSTPNYASEIFANDLSGSAAHTLSFTAGIAGGSTVQYTFNAGSVFYDEDSLHIQPVDPVTDKITFKGLTLQVSVS